jgi:hypothetical protein
MSGSSAVRARQLVVATAGLLTACRLDVANVNAPDIEQVFAVPASIEQTIASGYQSCSNAILTLTDGSLAPQLAVLSLEGYASVGNFGIGARVGIPRGTISNAFGSTPTLADYSRLALGGRLAANAVAALERLAARGATLGTPAQDLRARAFGFLAIGCHQGWLAMAFDSAGIVTPWMASDSIPALSGANEVMGAALAMLDSAVAIALRSDAQGPGGFPLPPAWLSGNPLSADGFVRLVRSTRARFRAGFARTPAQRAAVDWITVIADAEGALPGDFMIAVAPALGWAATAQVFIGGPFLQASPLYYGMADVSGRYDAWLAEPRDQRDLFLIVTPDQRWPAGTTRAEQRTNSTVPTGFDSRPYITNRSGADLPGHAWGMSQYFFDRLAHIRSNNNTGAFPAITRAEMDLLAAEGYLRTGDILRATAKIDITRVGRGGLPALSGVITGEDQMVPGGVNCVPRVPAPPAYTSTMCGNVWEAMKWEKRMETAFTGFGQWYFDSRGWGDLVENTALEFPVPYQEMVARQKPSYSLGGGLASSAQRGTYGY